MNIPYYKDFATDIKNSTEWSESQRTICIVDRPSDEEVNFLGKILGAIGLDLQESVFLLDIGTVENLYLFQWLSNKSVKQIFVFGIAPERLGLTIEVSNNELFPFRAIYWIFSESLATISADKQLKGALWGSLKKLPK